MKVSNHYSIVEYFVENGSVRQAIDVAIDHPDLLYAYPREGDRQDIENWISLYDRIAATVGGDAALVYGRLKDLSDLDNDGPKSSSPGSGGPCR